MGGSKIRLITEENTNYHNSREIVHLKLQCFINVFNVNNLIWVLEPLLIFTNKMIDLRTRFWLKDKLYEQHKSLTIKCIHYPLTVTWLKLRAMTFHIKRKLILIIPES